MAETALTLYSITDTLPALLDTYDMTPEGSTERTEIEAEITRYMEALPCKVDAVSQMLAHFDAQVFSTGAEIERLRKRKAQFERSVERLEAYVMRVLAMLPEPKRGPRKLEGNLATLALAKCPPSLDPAIDKDLIPACYLVVIPPTPASTEVDTAAVKKALVAGADVPGARLKDDKYRLRRT